MRSSLALLLLIAVLVPATGADARRKPSKSEKQAIAEVFNAPPKCAKVFISTVDQQWATYQFNAKKINVSPCEQVAADGVAILKKKGGQWRIVTAGSAFECPISDVPPKVVKDLHVRCFDTP